MMDDIAQFCVFTIDLTKIHAFILVFSNEGWCYRDEQANL